MLTTLNCYLNKKRVVFQMQSHPVSVLMISGIFYPKVDGSVIAVSNLLKSLQERGHNCYLVTRRLPKTAPVEQWENIPMTRVGPAGSSNFSRFLLSLNQAITGFFVMKRRRFDVIHAHGFASLMAGVLLSKALKKPVVITFHGFQRLWFKGTRWKPEYFLKLTYPLERFLVRNADAIISQSQTLKEIIVELYGVSSERVSVIPHIIDEDEFPYVQRPHDLKPIVLFVGTLARVHGVDLLIKSAPTVLKDLPETKFLIVGKGLHRDYLQKLVEDLRLEKSVFLVGPVFDRQKLAELYAESTVVVIPLKYKGYILSLVALEAMSTGRPVITTMTLDADLKKHGVFETGTNPLDIAESIKKVLSLKENDYATLTLLVREYIEKRCSREATVSQIEKIYLQLIERA